MVFNSVTPNLMVESVDDTVDWYRRVFGAEVLGRMPESGEAVWAQVEVGESWLMFQSRGSLEEEFRAFEGVSIGGSFSLYVDVDDARGLHDELVDSGVDVELGLRETEYGRREFAVRDPNGYVLWFGEKLQG